MSPLKDSCCIICNKNITDSSIISIRDYMRPLSNPELSLYSFFQLISNFNQLDISEVPQNACDKCYQAALHVLDFQTLCNKAVDNIKTNSEDIKPFHVGNDCDDDLPINESLSLYLPEEDTVDGYDVVEIITKNSDNAKDEDIASLPALVPAIRKRKQASQAKVEKQAERVQCGHCHKLYRRDYMHIHKRTHTGERPFKCKHCTRYFNSTTSLKQHMRIHYDEQNDTIQSDAKPFTCPKCPLRFRFDTHLKQHMVTHAW